MPTIFGMWVIRRAVLPFLEDTFSGIYFVLRQHITTAPWRDLATVCFGDCFGECFGDCFGDCRFTPFIETPKPNTQLWQFSLSQGNMAITCEKDGGIY